MNVYRFAIALATAALVAGAAGATPSDLHVIATSSLAAGAHDRSPYRSPRLVPGELAALIATPSPRGDGTRATLRPGGVLLHYVWVETDRVPSFAYLPPSVVVSSALTR